MNPAGGAPPSRRSKGRLGQPVALSLWPVFDLPRRCQKGNRGANCQLAQIRKSRVGPDENRSGFRALHVLPRRRGPLPVLTSRRRLDALAHHGLHPRLDTWRCGRAVATPFNAPFGQCRRGRCCSNSTRRLPRLRAPAVTARRPGGASLPFQHPLPPPPADQVAVDRSHGLGRRRAPSLDDRPIYVGREGREKARCERPGALGHPRGCVGLESRPERREERAPVRDGASRRPRSERAPHGVGELRGFRDYRVPVGVAHTRFGLGVRRLPDFPAAVRTRLRSGLSGHSQCESLPALSRFGRGVCVARVSGPL